MSAATARRTALTDVRVFDGHELTGPTTVVIDGDVIGTDATGAEVVDGAGATLLPGLIDAHIHLGGEASLRRLAAYGVTTALDMGSWPMSAVDGLRGLSDAADFRTAGLSAVGPGGNHARMPGRPADSVIRTPEDARRHVAARIAEGVDYIKGIAEVSDDDGAEGPAPAALQALVGAAHDNDKFAIVHAVDLAAFHLAVGSGADVVTHVPLDGVVAGDDVDAMARNKQIAVPTLTMMRGMLAARGAPHDHLATSVDRLRRAGVPILAGTDSNVTPGVPFSPAYGSSLHDELELLVDAGLPPAEALRAATIEVARRFDLPDRGAIRAGLRADLLLVQGDPTRDVTVTRRIEAVWCAGHPVPPSAAGR